MTAAETVGAQRVLARCARVRRRLEVERWLAEVSQRAIPVLAVGAAAWVVARLLGLPERWPLIGTGIGLLAVAARATMEGRFRVPSWRVVAWTDRESGAYGALMRAEIDRSDAAVPVAAWTVRHPHALGARHAAGAVLLGAAAVCLSFVRPLPAQPEDSPAIAAVQAAIRALPTDDPAARAVARDARESLDRAQEDGRLSAEELRMLARIRTEAARLGVQETPEQQATREAVERASAALTALSAPADATAAHAHRDLAQAIDALAGHGLIDGAHRAALESLLAKIDPAAPPPHAGDAGQLPAADPARQAALDALRREVGEMREVARDPGMLLGAGPGTGGGPGQPGPGRPPNGGWPGEPNQPGTGAPGQGGTSPGGGPADLYLSNAAPESFLDPEGIPFSARAGGRQVTVATVMARRPGDPADGDADPSSSAFEEGTSTLYRERLTLPRHRDAIQHYFGAAENER